MRIKPNQRVATSSIGKTKFESTKNGKSAIEQYSSWVSFLLAKNNRQLIIIILFILWNFIALGLLIYAFNLPRTEPIVVSVNEIGQTQYYGRVNGTGLELYDKEPIVMKALLTDFIEKTRTIGKDSDVLYFNITRAMGLLDKKQKVAVKKEMDEDDPFAKIGQFLVTTKIESIVPVSAKSWQVDWFETKTTDIGTTIEIEKFRGIFMLEQVDNEQYDKLTELEKKLSPLGIFITNHSITKIY